MRAQNKSSTIQIFKEIIRDLLIGMIGAAILTGVFFGAVIQEQDKLSTMAVAEVSE